MMSSPPRSGERRTFCSLPPFPAPRFMSFPRSSVRVPATPYPLAIFPPLAEQVGLCPHSFRSYMPSRGFAMQAGCPFVICLRFPFLLPPPGSLGSSRGRYKGSVTEFPALRPRGLQTSVPFPNSPVFEVSHTQITCTPATDVPPPCS